MQVDGLKPLIIVLDPIVPQVNYLISIRDVLKLLLRTLLRVFFYLWHTHFAARNLASLGGTLRLKKIASYAGSVVVSDWVLLEQALHHLFRFFQQLLLKVFAVDLAIDCYISDVDTFLDGEAWAWTDRRVKHLGVDEHEKHNEKT